MSRPWLNNGFRIAVGVLFCLGVAWLAGGRAMIRSGMLYLDNPAHLAEITERSTPGWTGWSELAFCGFPAGLWHSPLLYEAAAWAVRIGVPLSILYPLLLATAFLLPGLVLFFGARRRTDTIWTLLLAGLLLLQPPVLYGIGSVWGGMWTFYLSAGAFLWLMQRWSGGRGSWLGDAALIGFIGLSHLFVLALVPVLALVRLIVGRRDLESRRSLLVRLAAACVLGLLASAAYWLPPLLAHGSMGWEAQHLSPGRLLWALCVPTNLQTLTSAAPLDWREALQPGTIPMLLLIALGVWGGCSKKAVAGRVGLVFAAAVLIGLLVLPLLPSSVNWVWGPVSWRLLYIVRLGLAWSAVEAMPQVRLPVGLERASVGLVLLCAIALAAPLKQAVRDRDPEGSSRAEVQALWNRIRSTYPGSGFSRIYLQDTYGVPGRPESLLSHSHMLALTSVKTGRNQVGAYYGMAPQPTAEWTSGELGLLCGLDPDSPDAVPQLLERLRRTRCNMLAATSPAWRDRLSVVPELKRTHDMDRFTLYQVELFPSAVIRRDQGPGCIDIQLMSPAKEGRVEVSETWHPFWRLEPSVPGARLERDEFGLIVIQGLPPETTALTLKFCPPGWPRNLSLLVWAGLAGVILFRRCHRRQEA